MPLTDVQRPTVLRGEVDNARGLQAFRTRVTWDPRYFALVPDSVTAANENFAVFYEAGEGELQLDLAVLGGSVSGRAAHVHLYAAPRRRDDFGPQQRKPSF